MKIRKNARWLTTDERRSFLEAVVTLKAVQEHRGGRTMRLYDFYPLEHCLVRNRFRRVDDEPMGDGGHGGPGAGTTFGRIEPYFGDLHLRGQLVQDELDFTAPALHDAIGFHHFDQPLAYLDTVGSFHLKGRALTNQPPIA